MRVMGLCASVVGALAFGCGTEPEIPSISEAFSGRWVAEFHGHEIQLDLQAGGTCWEPFLFGLWTHRSPSGDVVQGVVNSELSGPDCLDVHLVFFPPAPPPPSYPYPWGVLADFSGTAAGGMTLTGLIQGLLFQHTAHTVTFVRP